MDIINYLMVDWNLVEKVAKNQFIFERKSTGKKIFIITKNFLSAEERTMLTSYYLKNMQPFVARYNGSVFLFEDFMFGGILKWI